MSRLAAPRPGGVEAVREVSHAGGECARARAIVRVRLVEVGDDDLAVAPAEEADDDTSNERRWSADHAGLDELHCRKVGCPKRPKAVQVHKGTSKLNKQGPHLIQLR